ncbi:MAG: hypothetical protein V4488_07970 [Pseudomonadota bacterium]
MVFHAPARKIKGQQALSGKKIHDVMRKLYPKRNDYISAPELFEELVPELKRFDIDTVGKFKRLMKTHRRALLEDDKSRLSEMEIRYYCEWFGKKETLESLRKQRWFSYVGLVRNAAESEFGEQAGIFAS